MKTSTSFKMYLERQEQQDYLDVLASEFGIDPEQLAKTPQVASFIGMGDTYNLTPYQITGIERDESGKVTGVKVKVMHDAASSTRKRYVQKDGQYVQVDDDKEPDDQEHLVPINDLLKMLTQGQDPQQQAGGGMPGMPGGMM